MKKILSIILLLTLSQGGWFKYYTSSYEQLMVGEWEYRVSNNFKSTFVFIEDKKFYLGDLKDTNNGIKTGKGTWTITDTKIILSFNEGANSLLFDYEFHGSDKVCLYTTSLLNENNLVYTPSEGDNRTEKEYLMDKCVLSFHRINPK
tara:strand:- start:40 stop:480 length:441 start_codon:yes stop_codon:yes gene_type:complete